MKVTKMLLSLIMSLVPITSYAGHEIGHGGDTYSKEFVSIGYDIVQRLVTDPIKEVDTNLLVGAIVKTSVSSKESLTLNGATVSAINYRDPVEPRIEVSRNDWDKMASESFRKTFLVFHEYLSIIGVDDSKYQISSKLDRAGVCQRTPAIRRAIEDQIHVSCDRMIVSDLSFITEIRLDGYDTVTTSLQSGDFAYLYNLKSLHLVLYALKTLAGEIWGTDLKNLESFSLSTGYGSAIKEITSEKLKGLESVTYMTLQDPDAVIRNNTFDGFQNIKDIFLVADLEAQVLSRLNKLERLLVASRTYPAGMFKGLTGLKEFRIDPLNQSNGAPPIPPTKESFEGLESIKDLMFSVYSEGDFGLWPDDTFKGFNQLSSLSLYAMGEPHVIKKSLYKDLNMKCSQSGGELFCKSKDAQ